MMRMKAMILVGTMAVAGLAACAGKKEPAPVTRTEEAKVTAPTAAADLATKPEPTRGPIVITVTETGFQPDKITVKKGEPVTFAFTRTTDRTCAKEVVMQVSPTEKIEKPLPLNERVEVTTTFPNSGEVKYACGMNMFSGVVTVQ
jgi:plastocyanin